MLASNPQYVAWVLRVKSNIDSGTFRSMQIAASKALSLGKEWYEEINTIYRPRRVLAEEIATMLGCKFDPAQRGMFLWAKVPEKYKDGAELADKILYDARVFITPGMVFGSEGDKFIRISLCATEEKLKEAKERIKTIL